MTNKVFIGWDPREDVAWNVAAASISKHSDMPIHKLVKANIPEYKRTDLFASSEFTLTRFFVPYLSGYKGYSIFLDCDILCTTDISKILDEVDPNNMVTCVQHPDYKPKTAYKMDHKKQFAYPRKNWSSVMVFNNAKCEVLLPELLNNSTPKYLHRMMWAPDDLIGNVSHTWNYLAGYYSDIDKPNIIHYTDGGPWFEDYIDCDFAREWIEFYEKNNISSGSGSTEELEAVQALHPIRGGVRQS